jgi:hypothetical protein
MRALVAPVAERAPGALGGCESMGAPLKATICITHGEPLLTAAVAR